MTYQTREYIAQAANIILAEYQIETPIADMDTVLTRMHGKVKEAMDYTLDGIIEHSDEPDIDFVINLVHQRPVSRRNVALAQAIGHIFLHLGYRTDVDTWKNIHQPTSLVGFTENEFESNEFAVNFLMPRAQYVDYVTSHMVNGRINLQELAEYFGVPASIAMHRGRCLGVLTWV